jgi:hypothetical protein
MRQQRDGSGFSTSTGGKDYVLHVRRGEKTLCKRAAADVNCCGAEEERTLTEESGCKICVRKLREESR